MLIFVITMFKSALKYCVVVTLAMLFVSIAGAYNFVQYCCDSCENEGVEVLLHESCEDMHEHEGETHSCCTSTAASGIHAEHAEDNCKLQFFQVDEATTTSVQESLIHKLNVSYSAFLPTILFAFASKQLAEPSIVVPPDDDIGSSGRTILASVCILRI